MKVKEVPPAQASEFLKDVDKDPKFTRWQERMAAAEAATAIRNELSALRVPPVRTWAFVFRFSFLVLLFSAPLPWFAARAAVVAVMVAAIVFEDMQAKSVERVRVLQVQDLEHQLAECERVVLEADQAMATSVKIIDPDSFGAPQKKETAQA